MFTRFLISAIFAVSVGLVGTHSALAFHVVAGSISWECQGSGEFVFKLTVLRDCTGDDITNPQIQSETYAGLGAISLSLVSSEDVSPTQCGVSCADEDPGAVEKLIFESAPVMIDTVIPPTGLVFSYYKCCRTTVENLVTPQANNMYFRAIMYPFGSETNAYPCFDSSPEFAAESNNLLCSGYEFRYSNAAIDPDLDAMTYNWSPAYQYDNGYPAPVPIAYMPNYAFDNPLPNPLINGTYDQATIDQNTGLIEYDTPPGLAGMWGITISVYGWRNGQLISENSRELILSTSNTCPLPNQVPQPNGAANTSIVVNAGDLVTFDIGATDPDMPNGIPQEVTMTAYGNLFAGDFTNPNNCSSPPCATLNSIPPVTGVGGVTTQFNWQTDCSHLTAYNLSSYTYDFVFRFEDDNCPIPGVSFANVSVTVLGDEIMPSPEARCVSVIDDDNIQIDWETIAPINPMPASFAYVVYHSTSPNGPWTEIGTVTDVNIGSFIHSTGMATNPLSTGANYYQIRTRSGCITAPAETPALYTVSSVFLDIDNNGSTVDLSWNHVVDPPLGSAGGGAAMYNVFERNPSSTGTWNLIYAISDLSYTRVVLECNDIVDFKIELEDNLSCTSISNVETETLTNLNPPAPQQLDSVSIDPNTGLAILGWPANDSLFVTEYLIQVSTPTGYAPAGSVFGHSNTFFDYQASNASTESECFRISSMTNCGIPGAPTLGQRHCTMLLDVSLEPCEKTNYLSWSSYDGWDEGVKEYEILVSKDGGQELKVATVHPDSLRFSHQSLQLQATYCYRVRAVRNTTERITSTSNEECILVYISKIPDYHYGYETTVPHNEKVLHQFFLDSTAGISKIEVHRGQDTDTTGFVGEVDFDPLTRFYEFSDFRARPNLRPYYYRTIVYDECEHPMDTSDFTRTIYLEVEANTDRTNVLTWNEYVGWPTGIEHFDIYRDYVGSGDFEYLTTLPVTTLTYTDNVVELLEGEGNFCYYIEAAENGPWYVGDPPYSFDQRSRSNIGCAPQHPNIFIPNAFAPNGRNKLFLPVSIYVDYQSYVFTVYDRFGGHIMRTLDKNLGWDGTLSNGMDAAQGVYGYTVEYETAEGVSGVKTGTITLYR